MRGAMAVLILAGLVALLNGLINTWLRRGNGPPTQMANKQAAE
jgi:hypothetical protein